jgi:putative NADPH-quinone reductase
MKNILIINGHPNAESFNAALVESYKKGALQSGAKISEINIRDLKFNPNLEYGYSKRMELEPDLLEAWKKMNDAHHIVFVFPMWWGFTPAILKGFFDRMLLPGFAFKYRENSMLWDKLLKGKTAHIICTTDYPIFYYKWILGESGIKTIRKMILGFCGIKTTRTTYVGPIRNSTGDFRAKNLNKIESLGIKLK